MTSLRLVFMGTPDFAVASLRSLHGSRHTIVGVVTAPDKPAGRGQHSRASAVKDYAITHDLYVLQPTNLKHPEFIDQLKALKADLFVVVAFRMLPEIVWQLPPLGTINLHASLLPQYRGAAPINWAIINGEHQTGVTTFFIEKEIDTGKIIAQETLNIGPNECAGELHDRLMTLGAETLVQTVDRIAEGNVESVPQSELLKNLQSRKAAPKIFPPDCVIDWNESAQAIHNKIRGLSPFPGARTTVDGKNLKLFAGYPAESSDLPVGVFKIFDNQLLVGTETNDYCITELQLEGKKRMMVSVFLNGLSHIFD